MQGPFIFFALFLFGLAFGSFLNVVALRYNRSETTNYPNLRIFEVRPPKEVGPLRGRSHCMKCGTTLRWFELVPLLSFVFLRGRCRTCKERISWQYPVVEFIAGLLFVFVPFVFLRLHEYTNLARIYESPGLLYLLAGFWIFVFLLLLLMSIIDLRHYIIPDVLNLLLFLSGIPAIILKAFSPPFQQFFVGNYSILFVPFFGIPSTGSGNIFLLILFHIFGSLVAGGFFWAIYALSKRRGIGFGDVKLGFALGFLLGWPDILFAMVFAFLLGGVWGGLVLVFSKITSPNNESGTNKRIRVTMKSKLPFGPFFALGVLWLVFFGEETFRLYFSLFIRT